MSQLKDKLYNYEQLPPATAWDNIAQALDEAHLDNEFPSKLYNAEAAPPAGAWDRISGALEPAQAPIVPMRNKAILRYAIAAMLIGLVAFGVMKWVSKPGSNEVGNLPVTKVNTQGNKTSEPVTSVNTEEKKSIQPSPAESNPSSLGNNVLPKARAKKARDNYASSEDISDTEPIYAYNEHATNMADRYIMLMTPDGGIIRMSKKWGDLVCCVSGQEQDENCKDQIKKWQQKIACSSATTSAGNFMDILSLVSSLNETEL